MTRPVARLVYDRDTAPLVKSDPVACHCDVCRQAEQDRQDQNAAYALKMALAGLAVGALLVALASLLGVQL